MAWLRTCSLACLCAGASAVFWEVTEGIMCEVDAEDCIRNVEAPGGSYFGSDSCRFRVVVGDWDCHAISVDYFEVDTPDSLRVNGVGYTGTSSPSGIVPSSDIQWTVRSTLPTGMGFRLCPEDVCATEAAAAKGSGTSMLMISILCVVGVVICGLAGACYFLSRKPRPAVVLPTRVPAPKRGACAKGAAPASVKPLQVYISSHSNQQIQDNNGIPHCSRGDACASQWWTLRDAGDGQVFIVSHRGKYLADDGRPLAFRDDEAGATKWSITDVGDGQKVRINSSTPGMRMESNNGRVNLHGGDGHFTHFTLKPELDNQSLFSAGDVKARMGCGACAKGAAPKPPVVMGAAVSATPIRDAGIASGSAHDAMRETPAREVVGHFVKQAVRTDKVPQQDRAAPGYWTNVVLASDFCGLVDVSRHETSAIERMLHDTFKEVSTSDRKGAAMPKSLKIVKVKRNENLQLWQKYTAGRYGIQNTHGHRCVSLDGVYGGKVLTLADLPPEVKRELNPRVNEHFLWHGTNPVAADAICKTGFDLARAGSNAGSMYGPGTYFAECSSKSDEYANSSNVGIYDGMCCLLLCRVVLGEVQMLTNAGEAVHGIVKTSMESGMYDSVLGNRQAAVGTYREFVVYQEDQMYPEYVVIYERQF